METMVREQVIKHMKNNKFFTDRQYGFISGRSTSLQLLNVLDNWTEALDNDSSIDAVYMDYMKAFDTVPHRLIDWCFFQLYSGRESHIGDS
jgi:hypothetical protein